MKVVSVQEIVLTMTGTSSANASITAVGDLSKSIVVGTWKMSSVTGVIPAQDITCDLWLSNSSTVNIQRDGTQGTITATVFIIEFGSGVTVQKGTFSMTAGGTTDSATITAAVLADSFSGAFYRHGVESGSPSNDSDPDTRMVTNVLTTTTNLAFTRNAGRGTINGHWFVVEDTGNIVTKETFLKNASGTMSKTLAASRSVVLANTFLISSQRTPEVTYNDEAVCSVKLLNTTTLEAQDGYNTTEPDQIEINVVENANINVQQFDITATGTSGTIAITSVDLALSIIIPTILNNGTADTGYTNGNLDERFVQVKFDSATQISWSRGATSQNRTWTIQVIEFQSNGVPTVNLIVQDALHNHLADNTILTTINPPNITSVPSAPFDYDEDTTVNGTNFGALIGTTKIYISDASTLAGGINEVEVTSIISGYGNTSFSIDLSTATGQLKTDLDTLGPGSRYIIIDKNGLEDSFSVFIYRAKAFDLSLSANIAASGENTTAQLIAPATKTTGDFGGGRIQDDINPATTINLALNKYGEWEYSIVANAQAVDAQTYEFRVILDGSPATIISVTPEWLIGASTIELIVQNALHSHNADNVILTQKHTLIVQDSLHSHNADNTIIAQKQTLTIQDSLHSHTVVNIVVTQKQNLVVQDSLHNHNAQNIGITQKNILTVQNALHSHIADVLTITQKNTLVVADSLHGHIADNTQLTSKNTLVVQDSLHTHSSSNIDLIEAEVVTIQSTLHSHIADNVALIQKNTIVVSNTVHTHTAKNTILTQKNTLIVQESLHSHTADNIVVSTSITLVVQDSLHTHFADVLNLIQKSTIFIQDSIHNHIADNVIVTQKHILVIQDSLHTHSVNNIDIVSKNTLVVQDTIHTHVSSNVALLEGNVLVIQSSVHSHSSENVALLQANILAIDNAVHSHIVNNVSIVQKNTLIVQDSLHSHIAQNIVLGISLIIQDSVHSHNAENISVIQSSILTVQDSTHTHVSDVPTLIQSYILGVQDSLHALTSDNITLGVDDLLIVQNSLHSHIVDNIGLNQKNTLAIQNSLHNHTVENINLSQSFTLTIEDGLHSHIVANIGLTQKQILEIQDSVHAHTTDIINLIVAGLLEVQDSLHNHTSENINLIQKYTLEVQETIHNHIVDNLTVVMGVTLTNIDSTLHSHTVDSLTIIILKFITMIGKFKTGATVTVDIYNLLDNSLVINAASMAEILATDYFKYKLTGITTPNQEFLYIMTDGVSQQSGKLIFRENLIGELEAYSIDDVWTEEEKQEVLAYSQKSSNNAEQVNNKF